MLLLRKVGKVISKLKSKLKSYIAYPRIISLVTFLTKSFGLNPTTKQSATRLPKVKMKHFSTLGFGINWPHPKADF